MALASSQWHAKQSGTGRDTSLPAFDKYTDVKATRINLGG